MRIRMGKSLLIILMALVISDIAPIPVYAADSVTYSGAASYPTRPDEQYRTIKVIKDPAWTNLVTVKGQPTRGTYVKKGDSLFYGEKGGNSASISFGVNLLLASVSFSVPEGMATSSYYGKSLVADQSGYYLIKAKKKIKPTIILTQFRHKKSYPNTSVWGPWEAARVTFKSYELVQTYSTLVKQ